MKADWIPDSMNRPRDPCRILLISSEPDVVDGVRGILESMHLDMKVALNARSGIETALTFRPELVLIDQNLPDATCCEMLSRLRLSAELAEVPLLVITTGVVREQLQSWFDAGATDYVGRPFLAAELKARVRTLVGHHWLLEELGRAANTDPVTGLPNRRLLQRQLQHAIDRAASDPDASFALLLIDFDRFRLVNDSLGYAAGDLLLAELARRLRNNIRAEDITIREDGESSVARLGGDEFIVILEGVPDASAAATVAERLISVIEQPFHLDRHTIRSSASVGVVHSAGGYELASDMLRDASVAMFEAKERGRGCHVEFVQPLGRAVRHRLELQNALRDAVGTDQMFLSYQPIVSLETRRIESVEALLRWKHPEWGFIPPSDFIPVAEDTRLILPLSDLVLRSACEQFMEWRRESPELAPHHVSVNLSRVQLTDPQLVTRTLAILEEIGMPASCLQLEVTESHIMQQKSLAVDLLGQIRRHGVRLAMDDFGTGYSSLACLQEYPFDELKVDRALTAQIGRGRGYAALLQAIMSLAESLGLEVVAEGIERPDQLALLQALGYCCGQGYLLGRPMSAMAIADCWRADVALKEAV